MYIDARKAETRRCHWSPCLTLPSWCSGQKRPLCLWIPFSPSSLHLTDKTLCIRSFEHPAGPVVVQPCLKCFWRLCRHHCIWERVPVVDYPHAERVSSAESSCPWLAELPSVPSSPIRAVQCEELFSSHLVISPGRVHRACQLKDRWQTQGNPGSKDTPVDNRRAG